MNTEKLFANVVDVIQEGQLKLGYRPETIRLYYPLNSLNLFLGTQLDAQGMMDTLAAFAAQYADVLSRISAMPTLICDRDHVIAAAGVSKREFLERRITPILENYMENRRSYSAHSNSVDEVQTVEGVDHAAAVIYPIIAAGDVTGAVVMLKGDRVQIPTDTELKLAQSAAAFLGKQMEE